MIKTFFRRLKLGFLPAFLISSIALFIVGIIYLVCISNVFAGIIGILLFIFMIYLIGESREKNSLDK